MHALYAASVRQRVAIGRRAGAPVLRFGDASPVRADPPMRRRHARLGGFDLHANTSVRAKNRRKLERLCRYLLRPPVAEDRLSFRPGGSVLLRLKTPWRDGTSHIALQPLELLEKLAALIPRPYVNLIVYHGVLATGGGGGTGGSPDPRVACDEGRCETDQELKDLCEDAASACIANNPQPDHEECVLGIVAIVCRP